MAWTIYQDTLCLWVWPPQVCTLTFPPWAVNISVCVCQCLFHLCVLRGVECNTHQDNSSKDERRRSVGEIGRKMGKKLLAACVLDELQQEDLKRHFHLSCLSWMNLLKLMSKIFFYFPPPSCKPYFCLLKVVEVVSLRAHMAAEFWKFVRNGECVAGCEKRVRKWEVVAWFGCLSGLMLVTLASLLCLCFSLLVCRWYSLFPCRLWAELCGSRLACFSCTNPGDVVYNPLTTECMCVCRQHDKAYKKFTSAREYPSERGKIWRMLCKDTFVPRWQPCNPFITVPLCLSSSFLILIPPLELTCEWEHHLDDTHCRMNCVHLYVHIAHDISLWSFLTSLSHCKYDHSHVWFCDKTGLQMLTPDSNLLHYPPSPNYSQGFLA